MKTLTHRSHGSRQRRAGFSLVEIALALGIAAFALIAIFGLLPVGINSNKTAAEQTAVVDIATGLIADMRQAPTAAAIATAAAATPPVVLYPLSPTRHISVAATTSPNTTVYYLDDAGGPYVQPADAATKQPTTLAADSRYRVAVTLTMPPATTPPTPPMRTATLATVTITWPAAAAPANANGTVTLFVALDRN